MMSEKKKVCPMKAIDFAHLEKKADYFGTAIQVVDCLGLRHLMKLECKYNVFMVQQFYATVVFDCDVNTGMTWMSGSLKLKAKLSGIWCSSGISVYQLPPQSGGSHAHCWC